MICVSVLLYTASPFEFQEYQRRQIKYPFARRKEKGVVSQDSVRWRIIVQRRELRRLQKRQSRHRSRHSAEMVNPILLSMSWPAMIYLIKNWPLESETTIHQRRRRSRMTIYKRVTLIWSRKLVHARKHKRQSTTGHKIYQSVSNDNITNTYIIGPTM